MEPMSAVVDEGRLIVAWQEFAVRTAKSLRQGGIESTPTRFKASKNNRIHKLVMLPYKVGVIATKLWN
jgi:hypothetical protein